MKGLTAFGIALLLASAFVPSMAAEAASEKTVRIRITNVSEVPYDELTLFFPGQQEDYGSLSPGESTEYREVAIAYPYASVMLLAEGRPRRAMAADYLGEKRLEPGSYTYKLDLIGGSPRFELVVDRE